MDTNRSSDILVPIEAPGLPPFRMWVGREEAEGKAFYGTDPVSAYIAGQRQVGSRYLIDLAIGLTEPGQLVCDLGAHVGEIALSLAASGRRVLAVEASPRNQQLLERSAEANSFAWAAGVHRRVR